MTAWPVPERFLRCESGEVVVTGSYTGPPPGAGRPLTAAFARVLAFRDGQLAELRQFTDSHRWQQAAAAAGLGTVRRMFEAAERRGAHALLGTCADDIVITEAASLPYGGVYHGRYGAVRHARAYTATWDHLQDAGGRRLEPLIWPAGDRVVVLWRQKATAADGRHLDLPAVDVIDLRYGKAGSLHMFPPTPPSCPNSSGPTRSEEIKGIPVGDVITGFVPVADQGRAAAAYIARRGASWPG